MRATIASLTGVLLWLALGSALPAQSPGSRPPARQPSKVAAMILSEIEKLVALPALTPESVAQATGVSWTPDPASSTPLYRVLKGTGAAGRPIKASELRLPVPGTEARGEILILDLVPGAGLTLGDVVARRGRFADIDVPIAVAPPTEPVYYKYRLGTGWLSFGVTRPALRDVVSVVIDRTPAG
jgi:hypothetical protein